MANEQIRVKRIKIKDIYDFACCMVNRANNEEVLPITKHLALAHANNPYADKDDISLVVAYVGNRCAGYIGLIPGLLRIGDRFSKIYWGSTLFVSPKFRPLGVGIILIKNLLSMKIDFVGAEMSEMAEKMWRALGLIGKLGSRDVYVLMVNKLNFSDLLLQPLQKSMGNLRYVAHLVDTLVNIQKRFIYPILKRLYYRILHMLYGKRLKTFFFEEVNKISDYEFDNASAQPKAEFHRGVEWINWKLKYRWMLNFSEVDVSYANYHFGGLRNLFKYIALDVYSSDRKKYKGFVLLSVCIHGEHTVLKVLDYHIYNHMDIKYIFLLSLNYAKKYQADNLVLPSQISSHFERNFLTRILLNSTQHIYVCRPQNNSSPLAKSLKDIELNLCDGDYSFT